MHRSAKNKLRKTLAHFDIAFGAIDYSIILLDSDLKIMWCNDHFSKTIDKFAIEICNKPFSDILPFHERENASNHLDALITKASKKNNVARHIFQIEKGNKIKKAEFVIKHFKIKTDEKRDFFIVTIHDFYDNEFCFDAHDKIENCDSLAIQLKLAIDFLDDLIHRNESELFCIYLMSIKIKEKASLSVYKHISQEIFIRVRQYLLHQGDIYLIAPGYYILIQHGSQCHNIGTDIAKDISTQYSGHYIVNNTTYRVTISVKKTGDSSERRTAKDYIDHCIEFAR